MNILVRIEYSQVIEENDVVMNKRIFPPAYQPGMVLENRKKIAFLAGGTIMPWMQRDLQILQKNFEVSILQGTLPGVLSNSKWKAPRIFHYLIAGLPNFLMLFKEIRKADLTFGWFASRFVVAGILISKLLRRKSIVVVGGYDIENMPEINYGNMQYRRLRLLVSFGLKQVDLVLPFSKFATETVRKLTGNKANIRASNLACDTERFKPEESKEDIVITAGFIDKTYVMRKGFRTFVEAAKYLPEIKFYLIGKQRDDTVNELKAIATPNVEFPGFLCNDGLLSMYQRAKVFCLLSYQEGEGGSGVLGESMACGCVPVVSEKAVALRETVGDCGFYVPYGEAEATAEAIKKALEAPVELGEKARERIEKFYSMERREEELLRAVDEVLEYR
jgi:glycosyltransferase involved in cell wall biosynthesis